MQVVQVCDPQNCDKNPVLDVSIGKKTHNFCCQKGLQKSIDDFSKTVKHLK